MIAGFWETTLGKFPGIFRKVFPGYCGKESPVAGAKNSPAGSEIITYLITYPCSSDTSDSDSVADSSDSATDSSSDTSDSEDD